MSVLLVIFQINDSKKRAQVATEIEKRHHAARRLAEGSYAIHSEQLPVRIYDELKQHLAVDDRLYVFPVRRPHTGYGPRATTEWLSTYLPEINGA